MMDVNVIALNLCTQLAIKSMLKVFKKNLKMRFSQFFYQIFFILARS
jgi:hypothetical protein